MKKSKAKGFTRRHSSQRASQSQQTSPSNKAPANKPPQAFLCPQTIDTNEKVHLLILVAIVIMLILISAVGLWVLISPSMNQPEMVVHGPGSVNIRIWILSAGDTTLLLCCLRSLTSIARSLIKK